MSAPGRSRGPGRSPQAGSRYTHTRRQRSCCRPDHPRPNARCEYFGTHEVPVPGGRGTDGSIARSPGFGPAGHARHRLWERAADQVGERDLFEDAPKARTDRHPNSLEPRGGTSVVKVLRPCVVNRRQWALNGPDDVRDGDRFGGPGQRVATSSPPMTDYETVDLEQATDFRSAAAAMEHVQQLKFVMVQLVLTGNLTVCEVIPTTTAAR